MAQELHVINILGGVYHYRYHLTMTLRLQVDVPGGTRGTFRETLTAQLSLTEGLHGHESIKRYQFYTKF